MQNLKLWTAGVLAVEILLKRKGSVGSSSGMLGKNDHLKLKSGKQ